MHSEDAAEPGRDPSRAFFRRSFEEQLTTGVPYIIATYVIAWVLVAWVMVQWLTFSGMRYDTYEMLLMGHEWQLAYWKHPALPPWVAEAVFVLTGHNAFALAVLPVAWVAAALWLVNRLCRPILGEAGATIATALSLGSWYIMTVAGHWNHNIAQLPFWVLAVLCYRRAILKPSTWNWIALAVVAELLLQTKYTGVLLLGTLAAHACWFKSSRKVLGTPQAWLGIAVALALIVPQFLHVLHNNRTALTYYSVGREHYHAFYDYILGPLKLLGSQIFFHAAVVILVLAARPYGVLQRARAFVVALPERSLFDTSLLIASTAMPLAIGLVFYDLTGLQGRSEAFGSMFMLVGPSVVACAGRVIHIARPRLVLALFALTLLGPPLGNCLDPIFGPLVGHRLGTEQIPFSPAADTLERTWLRLTGRPLTILAGNVYAGGGFAAFMEPRPSVLIDGTMARSPWITKQRITSEGVMIVWHIKDVKQPQPPAELVEPLAGYRIELLKPMRIKTKWDGYAPPVMMGLAVILPEHSGLRK